MYLQTGQRCQHFSGVSIRSDVTLFIREEFSNEMHFLIILTDYAIIDFVFDVCLCYV